MNVSEYYLKAFSNRNWDQPEANRKSAHKNQTKFASLLPLRQWLNGVEVKDPQFAHRLCRLIPAQCPFARTVKIFGLTLLSIPPLCKINPLYEELMALRFRAICYLANQQGEDISNYC